MSSSSSDSSVDDNVKNHYKKIRSYKTYSTWRIMTLAIAKASGLKKYLTSDQVVLDEDEFDALTIKWLNSDKTTREGKLVKAEHDAEKKKRDDFAKAQKMMMNSVGSTTMIKRLGLLQTPKQMFEAICKKYGRESPADLNGLIEEIQTIIKLLYIRSRMQLELFNLSLVN